MKPTTTHPTPTGRRTRRIAAASVAATVLLTLAGTDLIRPSAASAKSPGAAASSAPLSAGGSALQGAETMRDAQSLHDEWLALPEVQQALSEIRAGTGADEGGDVGADSARAAAPVSLAQKFGSSFLKGLLRGAGHETFSVVLAELGFDSGDQREVVAALAQIQGSLSEIREQNRQIIEAIEQVHNEVLRANFKRANADVVRYSDNIQDTLRVIQHWINEDVTPEQSTVTLTVLDLRAHASDMRGAASDQDSGAVPLLLQAYDRNVSNTEQLWEAVGEYRDQVRASMAQAVAGIELAIEHWNHPSDEYTASHTVASESALATVDAMYATGVAPSGPGGSPFVQLQNSAALTEFAQGGVPAGDQWLWENAHVTAKDTEPWLQQLASNYRPANHGGMTLEVFLTSQGVPTSYVFTDAWGYRTTYEWDNVLKSRRNVYYTPEAKLGRIVGNQYHVSRVTFGDRVLAGSQGERCSLPWINCRWEWLNDYRGSALPEVQSQIAKWESASKGYPYGPVAKRWQNESHRHNNAQGQITVSRDGNLTTGGWLADSRPESIHDEAYGG